MGPFLGHCPASAQGEGCRCVQKGHWSRSSNRSLRPPTSQALFRSLPSEAGHMPSKLSPRAGPRGPEPGQAGTNHLGTLDQRPCCVALGPGMGCLSFLLSLSSPQTKHLGINLFTVLSVDLGMLVCPCPLLLPSCPARHSCKASQPYCCLSAEPQHHLLRVRGPSLESFLWPWPHVLKISSALPSVKDSSTSSVILALQPPSAISGLSHTLPI